MSQDFTVQRKSQLKGATGDFRKEYVNEGDRLICRAAWDSGVLVGYRYIEQVNGSLVDYRVGRFVADTDLKPYTGEPPVEPPAERFVEYHHDGIVERFVPEQGNG